MSLCNQQQGESYDNNICVLEEEDMQCGYIFFNEDTRLLKFFCTYCRDVYDNINYFCEHLSEHINDNVENTHLLPAAVDDIVPKQPSLGNIKEEFIGVELCNNQFDDNKIMVKELDEAEEIAAEVAQEMRQAMLTNNRNLFAEHEMNREIISARDLQVDIYAKEQDNTFECLSNDTETIPRKIETNRMLQKNNIKFVKKKITTVKVIAVKNRIAELYARIKYEEEKRAQDDREGIVQCDADDIMSTTSSQANLQREDERINTTNRTLFNKDGLELSQLEKSCKIIGETVITLLPKVGKPTDISLTSPTPSLSSTMKPSYRSYANKTTCPACGKRFRNTFSLAIHKRTHYLESNNEIKLAHKCSDCDQLFNKISELKDHLQTHYPDGYICRICNKQLSSLTMLETHMRRIHLKRPLSCKICNKSFSKRVAFETHKKYAHISNEETHRCHICGRKYIAEYLLNLHIERHQERVPKCCVVCGKITLRITQHMKIHTPRPKRVHNCSICGKQFNFSSGLNKHFKSMHKLLKTTSKSRKEHTTSIKSLSLKEEPTTNCNRKRVLRKKKINVLSNQTLIINENGSDQHILGVCTVPSSKQIVSEKEEESKRVIVELIQNATYNSFFPENYDANIGDENYVAPPMAREEIIFAVNSIANEL